MQFGIFKIFQIFGIVSTWATKALEDGTVTLAEAVELVAALCAVIGITPELDIPGAVPEDTADIVAGDHSEGADLTAAAGTGRTPVQE